MAIRQVDERFLVSTIIPALEKAEDLADTLDYVDNLRSRAKGENYTESALATMFTKTLDDLCLRVKYEGTLGTWKSIEGRLPDIRKRCDHKNKNQQRVWLKDENGKQVLSEVPVPICNRCHQQWLEALADTAATA